MLEIGKSISTVNIRVLTCLLALIMFGTFPVALYAANQDFSPPLPETQGRQSVVPSTEADITAVVVKSWGGGSASAWGELNTEWPNHGSTSIYIDTTTLGGATSFTYQDLVNTGADVVILSDPAGGNQQYSDSEIAAVSQYASEGHNVIGTYMLLQWGDTDNRGLAPIFGLRSGLGYNTTEVGISNVFNVVDVGNPLFTGIPNTWTSEGYPYTQTPADDLRWDVSDLAGAGFTAECDSYKGMISVYNAANYTGIYISNMPEYGGGFLDKQLLYNAITFVGEGPCPFEVITSDAGVLDSLRQARDEALAQNEMGQFLIGTYYYHTPELVQILLQHPSFSIRGAFILKNVMPGIHFLLGDKKGRNIVMTPRLVTRIQKLFADISEEGSDDLADTLSGLSEMLDACKGMRISEIWEVLKEE